MKEKKDLESCRNVRVNSTVEVLEEMDSPFTDDLQVVKSKAGLLCNAKKEVRALQANRINIKLKRTSNTFMLNSKQDLLNVV